MFVWHHHSIFFTLFVGPIPVTGAAFSFFFSVLKLTESSEKKKKTELVKKIKEKKKRIAQLTQENKRKKKRTKANTSPGKEKKKRKKERKPTPT